jgi:small subunit ribosomal protein S20
LAKTPRTWTGARSPSGLKRVRQNERRHAVLGPRRNAAKTLVKAALATATTKGDAADAPAALASAMSALDRAAKAGAIHPNAAARRKSRLALKMNAALGGAQVQLGAHETKQVSKSAAAKAAKARIAAGRATKAKGAQTAAGKARAALSKTTRSTTARTTATDTAETPTETPKAKTTRGAAKTTKAKTTTRAKATKASSSTTKKTTRTKKSAE